MARTFLITGARRGIGRALAERLAAAGHLVVGISRGADDCGFPGVLVSGDLTRRDQTTDLLADLASCYAFDGVINNVGFIRLASINDLDLGDFDFGVMANLSPMIQTVQALMPGMRQRGWGRIVNLSSLVVLGAPQRTVYAAAKSAVISFTRTWALELAASGITVNAVAPGPTETEMFRQNSPVGSPSEARFLSAIPVGRVGSPDELAAAIAFFLSEEAGFVTGQTLFVDGGASIGKALV